MFAEESYWDLMTSVPHIMFEFSLEIITGLILAPVFRWAIRRHDREHHGRKRPIA